MKNRVFSLDEIRTHPCPNLWHDLLGAGALVNGRIEVPEEAAAAILARCPDPALRGLGDVVAQVAQPIARAIDAVAGTHLRDCGGCKARRAKLNEWMPFGDAAKELNS